MASRRREPVAARWAAVIVNYNAGEHLLGCVRSVAADTSAGVADIVVVDNGSTDGSLEAISREPGVRVIESGGNVGLARAVNLGVATTTAAVVAVLNPDTVLRPGTAGALVGRLERDAGVGVVGPRIENPDGTTYPSARTEPPLAIALGHAVLGVVWPRNPCSRRYRALDVDPSLPRTVDWLSGAAMWFRRDALDRVGGWDERFFMFMEDVDVCRRLRDAGLAVEYDPSGSLVHVEGVSRAHHPYRMIATHHRSVWRYAELRWRGVRRLLLPFAGLALVARAGAAMLAHRIGGRRRRPQIGG